MPVKGFKLKNFQSFSQSGSGISDIKRLNIVIGPNNSGKSKILRASACLTNSSNNLLSQSNQPFEVEANIEIVENIGKYFDNSTYGGGLPGQSFWSGFGQYLDRITIRSDVNTKNRNILSVDFETRNYNLRQYFKSALRVISEKTPHVVNNELLGDWHYVAAERDIRPEPPINSKSILPNGDGITRAVVNILNNHDEDSEIVEKNLLNDINAIASPEYYYERITTQKISESGWEIFLYDSKHGRVALSQCGSGIKTIIHIAALFNIIIDTGGQTANDALIILEEIENSLHPRTQRNLLKYIDGKIGADSICIIATHSSVCLDYFQGREDVSFTKVFQEDGYTQAHAISAFVDRTGVLDALGVKASDALNSNCVVWVEGPSDRIYLKKIISLISDDDLVEGQHYSVMFYGGRLLSHLTADDPEMVDELISLLKINRNSAILIDSDRKQHGGWVNETKRRIKREANETGAYVWTSQGREIENYLKPEFWASHLTVTQSEVGPYNQVFEAVKGKKPDGKALQTKVELARWAVKHMSIDDLALDAETKVKELVKLIRGANYL